MAAAMSSGRAYPEQRTESSAGWTIGSPTHDLPGHGRARFAHGHLHPLAEANTVQKLAHLLEAMAVSS